MISHHTGANDENSEGLKKPDISLSQLFPFADKRLGVSKDLIQQEKH